MSKLILPKATTAAREAATPVEGEIFYDKDKKSVYFGDGATAGGISLRAADLTSAYVYGIDHDTSVATAASACKRVVLNHDHDTAGDELRYTEVDTFSQMPAHNFRRCVISDLANRTVAYYLNASDSTKKENGQAANLSGGDGDVMVEIPVCHYRIDTYTDSSDHVHHVYLVSNKPFTGSAIHRFFYVSNGGATARVQYVGAFHDVLCDSSGAVKTQSAADTPATYATGDKFRSIAGVRPHGNATRGNYRAGATANGGTNINAMFGQFLFMMMVIDGCTFDTQTSISIGYSQLSQPNYAAVRKTGRTVIFGNGTGEILADDADSSGEDYDILTLNSGNSLWNSTAQSDPSKRVVQFSYRGIEDPYGSQWVFEDGIQKYQNSTANDYSQSGYWCTNDPELYPRCDTDMGAGASSGVFPSAGYTGASLAWVHHAFPKSSGYVKEFDPVTFFALDVSDGSSSTYLCDYFNNSGDGGPEIVIRGGTDAHSAYVGGGFVSVADAITSHLDRTGGRLAC